MKNLQNNTLERRSEILNLLFSKGQLSVIELSQLFNISEVSIRNDLAHLEQKGLLIRTRGGAIKQQAANFDLNLNQKLKKNYKQKQKIGKKATDLIKEGDTIILDSGSTTLELAKNLQKFSSLTIITNSLPIAEQLSDNDNIDIIIPGGVLRREMRSLVGSVAEKSFLNYSCDKVFLAVDGIDSEFGISTPLTDEAMLGKAMIEASKQIIVVSDSSKFKQRCFAKIASISNVNLIITDSGIPEDEKKKIENEGVEIIIAKS